MEKNSKIGVLGAGVEGMALLEYLVKKGFTDITLFDEKPLVEGLPEGVKTVLGPNSFGEIFDCEVLFRSPGIHTSRLEEARLKGIEITSTTRYFFENCPCPIIGVTGTKGKGTTSTLIYMILKAAGLDVYLGGNIGESPLTFLDKLNADSRVILELSSFQLQDLTLSPHVAVVLRVTSDHMDYHKDREEYMDAKMSIVRYQKDSDICIVNGDYEYALSVLELTAAAKYAVSRSGKVANGAFVLPNDAKIVFCHEGECEDIGDAGKVGLPGDHNLENILPAVTVGRILDIPIPIIQKVIYSFNGLPNRLEFVREVAGVKYYNDSFSTTPETSVSATYAFKEPVILIAGGSEKYSDYTQWAEDLQKNPRLKAVFLTGITAQRMIHSLNTAAKKLQESGFMSESAAGRIGEFPLKVYEFASIKEAIPSAAKIASPGDNIVMSPAAASFDQFKNYKERGQKFKEWVNAL